MVEKSQALSFFISNGRFIMNEEYLKELIVGIRAVSYTHLTITSFLNGMKGGKK